MAILSFDFTLSALLVWIFLVWVKRVFWLRRFRKIQPPLTVSSIFGAYPKISIVVPARNEEKNIGNCLEHLLKQTYPHYEIVVVDDRSTDKTPQIIEEYKNKTKTPIKHILVEKLPADWTGKNHAVSVGAKAASGEWILFTDADTTHQPQSIETALVHALEKKIDFLTLSPEIDSKSFWEETVQPLAVSSLALWFDPEKINDPKSDVVLANGQYIFIRKDTYEKIGGNEAVKNEVVEDVALAKIAKSMGYSVQFLDGTSLYSTRMYTSLKEIRTGWTRIFTYLFEKSIPAILHKIFMFLFFSSLSFAVLAAEILFKLFSPGAFSPLLFSLSLSVSFWIVLVRFFGNRTVKANPWYAFLHLLGSFIMIWILLACVGRIIFKRSSVWRGEHYK